MWQATTSGSASTASWNASARSLAWASILISRNTVEPSRIDQLSQAIQRYLDLMYDGDVSRYERVFRDTAQLHGLRDGKMAVLSSAGFKDLIAGRPSPKSL